MGYGYGTVIVAVIVMGLFLHGLQANQLGLYWDEAEQFLQPFQAAEGDILKYVFWDTFGYLDTERPVAHLFMVIHRAAFAVSLPLLHWTGVVLLVMNAALLAAVAGKILNEKWFVFAVGVIFITYPLSPLQAINPMLLPHLWSSLLALLTILFVVHGLTVSDKKRANRTVGWSVVAYVACILTHEVFAPLPPAFLVAYILMRDKQPNTFNSAAGSSSWLNRPSALCLVSFFVVLASYGLWRIFLLPAYGKHVYSISGLVLNPGVLLEKIIIGTRTALVPWAAAMSAITASHLRLAHILLSLTFFIFVWLMLARLIQRSAIATQHLANQPESMLEASNGVLRVLLIGFVLTIASIGAVAVSPASISTLYGLSPASRVNFVAAPSIALLLPGLLVCLMKWPRIASLIAVGYLLWIGFGWFQNGNIFTHRSSSPVLFDRYSVPYALTVIGYVIAVTFFTLTAILPSVPQLWRVIQARTDLGQGPLAISLHRHLLAGSVAGLVFFGSLFHFSIKNTFISEWEHHKARLEQLRSLVPIVADDTFLVFIDPRGLSNAPYTTHWEFSSYLLAIYDNWSILGNTDNHLRFHRDGIESFYGRIRGTWFPPGVRGPVLTHATLVSSRVAYNRLLLLEFDGDTLRIVPSMEVKTEEGEIQIVYSNLKRILSGKPVTTAAWRHVAGSSKQNET